VRDLSGRLILSRRISGSSGLDLASLPRGIFAANFQGARLMVHRLE
jgi:hypothetical protein